MTLDSTLGAGTTVTLYLPRAVGVVVGELMPPVTTTVTSATESRSETVLIVEDDDDVRESLSGALASLGYRILTARTGKDALTILRQAQAIDLVLSDVVMPEGVNGIEVVREAQRCRNGIKALLISGYPTDVLAAHGADGSIPLVAKPFRPDDLLAKVRHLLQHTRARPS